MCVQINMLRCIFYKIIFSSEMLNFTIFKKIKELCLEKMFDQLQIVNWHLAEVI